MVSMKQILVVLLAHGAASACVTLKKYGGGNCSGESANTTFIVGTSLGSPCWDMGTYSVKDQYCDSDGTFKQSVFEGNGCKGVANTQVFDKDHCLFDHDGGGYKLGSCEPGDCTAGGSAMCVSLKQYPNADCSGEPKGMEWGTGSAPGSPCYEMGTYSVKDQFCDSDGTYKQSVFMGQGCKGPVQSQVFDKEHCLYKMKLRSCEKGPCDSRNVSVV